MKKRAEDGHVPHWAKRTKYWLGFTAAVFALYAGAATIGLDLPRWAWISEHRALAGEVKTNVEEILKQKVDWFQDRVWKIENRIQDRGVTPSLRDQLREYEKKLREAEAHLAKVRGY